MLKDNRMKHIVKNKVTTEKVQLADISLCLVNNRVPIKFQIKMTVLFANGRNSYTFTCDVWVRKAATPQENWASTRARDARYR